MSSRYKPRGWFGDSHRHSLAAKGIRTYAKKDVNNSFFYAQRMEEEVSTPHLTNMLRSGKRFPDIVAMHPKADKESLRKRSIKILESLEQVNTLSTIDRDGVDETVKMAKQSSKFKKDVLRVLNSPQMVSFLSRDGIKVAELRREL